MSRTLISWFSHLPRNRSTVRPPLAVHHILDERRPENPVPRPHGGPDPAAVRLPDDVVVQEVPLVGPEGLPRGQDDHPLLPLRVDEDHGLSRAQRPRRAPSFHHRRPPLPTFSFSRQNAHVSVYEGAPQSAHFVGAPPASSSPPAAAPSSGKGRHVPLLSLPWRKPW